MTTIDRKASFRGASLTAVHPIPVGDHDGRRQGQKVPGSHHPLQDRARMRDGGGSRSFGFFPLRKAPASSDARRFLLMICRPMCYRMISIAPPVAIHGRGFCSDVPPPHTGHGCTVVSPRTLWGGGFLACVPVRPAPLGPVAAWAINLRPGSSDQEPLPPAVD